MANRRGNKNEYAMYQDLANHTPFSARECADLVSHGIKPWDYEEASHFLEQIDEARQAIDRHAARVAREERSGPSKTAFDKRLEEKPENFGYTDRRVEEAQRYGVNAWGEDMETLGNQLAGGRRWETRRANEQAGKKASTSSAGKKQGKRK